MIDDGLKQIADQWRQRLEDPAFKQLVASGKIVVNPLVHQLLAAVDAEETEHELSEEEFEQACKQVSDDILKSFRKIVRES